MIKLKQILLLVEGNIDVVKKLLTNADKLSYLTNIVNIDSSKNFIIKLTKFFLEDPTDDQLMKIKNTFDQYIEQRDKNWWKGEDASKNDIKKFDTFEDFFSAVRNIELKYNGLNKIKKIELYEKFKEIDPSGKYISKLIEFFLENPTNQQLEYIKNEFDNYITQKNNGWWDEIDANRNDIRKFDKFEDFAEAVHELNADHNVHVSTSTAVVDKGGSTLEIFGHDIDKNDITYIDDEVIVVHAPNMYKSIRYGQGFSSWCTARANNNYFYSYRYGSYGGIGESSLYYVYFPKRYKLNTNDNDSVLHFGVNSNGDISFTNRDNSEYERDLDWLKKAYPELGKIGDLKSIFRYNPPTKREKEIYSLNDSIPDDEFAAMSEEEKTIYLSSSLERDINFQKFEMMSSDLQNKWLKFIANDTYKKIDIQIVFKHINNKYVQILAHRNLDGNWTGDKIINYIEWLRKNTKIPIKIDNHEILSKILESASDPKQIVKWLLNNTKMEFDSYIIDLLLYHTVNHTPHEIDGLINWLLNSNKLELGDDETVYTLLNYSSKTKRDELINRLLNSNKLELTKYTISVLLENSSNKDELINRLLNSNKLELTRDTLQILLQYSSNEDELINLLLFSNKLKFDDKTVYTLLYYSSKRDELINWLLNSNKFELTRDTLQILLQYSSNEDELINWLLNNNKLELTKDTLQILLNHSSNKDGLINWLLNNNKLELGDHETVYTLLQYSSKTKRDELINLLLNSNKLELGSAGFDDTISLLLIYSSKTKRDELINLLLNSNKLELGDDTISLLLRYSSKKDEVINRLLNSNKLELTKEIISVLLENSSNKDELINRLLNSNKLELGDDKTIYTLLNHSSKRDEVINRLLNSNKLELTKDTLQILLNHSSNKDGLINQLLNGHRLKPLMPNLIRVFLYNTHNKLNFISNALKLGIPLNSIIQDQQDLINLFVNNLNNLQGTFDFLIRHGLTPGEIFTPTFVLSLMAYYSTEETRLFHINFLLRNNVPLTRDIIKLLLDYSPNRQNTEKRINFLLRNKDREKYLKDKKAKTKLGEYNVNYKDHYQDIIENVLVYENNKVSGTVLTPEIMKKILEIEKIAYPEEMQIMNQYVVHHEDGTLELPSIHDIANYMDCRINEMFIYVGSNWYIMACNRRNAVEIVDWASSGKIGINAAAVFLNIFKQFGNKLIDANCKEDTSYKFLMDAQRLGLVQIVDDEENSWGPVKMHDVKFKLTPKLTTKQ